MRREVVAVVTDSSSGLAPLAAREFGALVLPSRLETPWDVFHDGPVGSRGAAMAHGDGVALRALAPEPREFSTLFRDCAEAGADRVVAVLGGSALAGSVATAREAAEASPVPVSVVDTGTTGVAQALAALSAGSVAATGASATVIATIATEVAHRTQLYMAVDTLEPLRRAGRLHLIEDSLGGLSPMRPVLRIGRNEAVVVTRGHGDDGTRRSVLDLAALEAVTMHRPVTVVGYDPATVTLAPGLVDDSVLLLPSPMSLMVTAGPGLFMAASAEMPEAFHLAYRRFIDGGRSAAHAFAWTAAGAR